MCSQCKNTYANTKQTHPEFVRTNLDMDPDHEFAVTTGSQREAIVATQLNAANAGLDLVRPPTLGLGDFVAHNGGGPHVDMKGLYHERVGESLNSAQETLDGPLSPYVLVDTDVDSTLSQDELDQFHAGLNGQHQAKVFYYQRQPSGVTASVPSGLFQGEDVVEEDLGTGDLFN